VSVIRLARAFFGVSLPLRQLAGRGASPVDLVLGEEGVKVTIALSKRSVYLAS
jgi:hypothetical protein